MQHFLTVCFAWVQLHVYLGTFLFMAMESSVLPVPSEMVIPPAAYLAISAGGGILGSHRGRHRRLLVWQRRHVLALPRLGSRFHRQLWQIRHDHRGEAQRAEHWLHRYEAGGIFFARLLPVIRHLISIPAGIIRMNFARLQRHDRRRLRHLVHSPRDLRQAGPRHLRRAASQLDPGPAGVLSFIQTQSHWLVRRYSPPLHPLLPFPETDLETPRVARYLDPISPAPRPAPADHLVPGTAVFKLSWNHATAAGSPCTSSTFFGFSFRT